MKRWVFLISAAAGLLTTQAQSSKFIINGDASSLKVPAEWVFISYYIGDRQVKDSVPMRQGHYGFQGNVPEPTLATLSIKFKTVADPNAPTLVNSKRDYATVFLQPGTMKVASVDSFANVVVSGSKADDEYRMLQELAKPYNATLDELYRQFSISRKNKEVELTGILERQIDSVDALANENIYGTYVKNNPSSVLAMYALKNWAGYEIDADKIEPVFIKLPPTVQQSVSGKDMKEKIAIAKLTSVGQTALEFSQTDTLGKAVSLKSLRGKYLLIDFWASWCGPCRRENPNLVPAFNQYKDKGFQVLGVSLDRPGAKERWLQAIHDDGLTWTHVSDLQFWNNAVARQYGIQAIPQNLLLDPCGKIIGKNLRGEALVKKLATIYSN